MYVRVLVFVSVFTPNGIFWWFDRNCLETTYKKKNKKRSLRHSPTPVPTIVSAETTRFREQHNISIA